MKAAIFSSTVPLRGTRPAEAGAYEIRRVPLGKAINRPKKSRRRRGVSASSAAILSFALLLGDDEGLGIHPVGVPQHTQRTDLELIDSSHGQAADGNLPGFGGRHRRPGTECPARAL